MGAVNPRRRGGIVGRAIALTDAGIDLARRLLPAPLDRRIAQSLRARFVALALLPLFAGFPILVALLLGWGGEAYTRLTNQKVRSDLAVADGFFTRVRDEARRDVEALAGSQALADVRHDPQALAILLRERAAAAGLDYLVLVDRNRHVRAGSEPALGPEPPPRYDDGPVLRRALDGQAAVAVEVLSAESLAQIAPEFALRSRTLLRPSPDAGTVMRVADDEGLLLHAAAPLPGRQAVLVGGLLLNRNYALVDRIEHMVYPAGSLPDGSRGSATLFHGDVRIATTLTTSEGERATGTRVSAAVRERVLDRGEVWLGRAFVVDAWAVSGYEPLLDGDGRRVGMLYVGFLEAPFVRMKWIALAVLVALFFATMAAAALVSWRFTRGVVEPIERMRATMDRVALGALDARVGSLGQSDELAGLARHFDTLLDRLEAQNAALREWADALDAKVAERTRDLAAANARLLETQRQLAQADKLATIGQLAAGVAHEVNNPMAVIQGNLDLMVELLGEAAQPVDTEVKLIREQVRRIRQIVARLLQYAKPGQYAGALAPVDLAREVQEALMLASHQIGGSRVTVEQALGATARPLADRRELLQVLVNLVINALQAMPDGGRLMIASRDEASMGAAGVRVAVTDSGAGIALDDRDRLFTPFFTRKSGGNGLGLWMCRNLVERMGGTMGADSAPGGGAELWLWLPAERGAGAK
ncbi:sensor histidine kinase [Derxia gummosa]|uniref:histidine kinase n=1 Tax=Derxia gummosa DSM 723 TaxID=1121388 RepID=A0A8B6XBW2_9BURK|nr:HAMP domain-containing sensor histidine kinase [Derxia gummosa]